MAVLSDSERALATAEFIRDNKTTFAAVTKGDIRAALNALDDFLDTNAATINNAIPQPARGQLTQRNFDGARTAADSAKRLAIQQRLDTQYEQRADAIVRAVMFLIETDFVTGETIRVDGGRHVK